MDVGLRMIERRVIRNVSTCSEGVRVIIDLPKECRVDADLLGEYVAKILIEGFIRNLCAGCPLERSDHQEISQ